MDLERLRALLARLVLLNDRHELEHIGRATRFDTARYVDPARHQRELEVLFRRTPQLLAFSCDLPAPNTFASGRLGHVPVLLTRDEAGRVAAFVNACRHRGAPVASGCGEGRRLTCPYHGWTYGLDGELSGVPDRNAFDGCLEGVGLVPLPVGERYGLIVVNADRSGGADVDAYLGDLAPELEHLGLETLVPVAVHETEVRMNWKLGNDAAMEAYHVPVLHKATVASMTSLGYIYDGFGLHHRMGLLGTSGVRDHAHVEDPMALLSDLTLVHHLYPSSMVVVGSGIVVHQRCDPGATPDTSSLRVSTYAWGEAHDDEAAEHRRLLSDLLWKVVLEEDCAVQQQAQVAFSSGALDEVVFGSNEPGLRGMHANWDAAVS